MCEALFELFGTSSEEIAGVAHSKRHSDSGIKITRMQTYKTAAIRQFTKPDGGDNIPYNYL